MSIDSTTTFDQSILATVENTAVTVADLLRQLKYTLNWHLVTNTITRAVLEQLFNEFEIAATDAEIQAYVTSLRKERNLLTSASTQAWLNQSHLSDEDFFDLCEHEVKLTKLKETLFGSNVEQRYIFQKLDLESVELYRLVAESANQAKELAALLQEGADFYGLAKTCSLDLTTRKVCGYMGLVHRRDLEPNVEAAIFGTREGEVVGPIKTAVGHELYLIEKFHNPELNEMTRAMILEELFGEYLQQRISSARIKMFVS